MKSKAMAFLAAGGFIALAVWFVHAPTSAQPDKIPDKYHETVHKGLEYLVKHQSKDGHWEGDGGQHPVAMTGLAGLALLLEKESPDRRSGFRIEQPARVAKYSANIRKAVDWLIDKSQAERDGLIFSEHPSETTRYMEGHGLATLFLAGACKDEQDQARRRKLTDGLIRAVKYIAKAQSSQGGWYHTSKVEGHDFDMISATVIQIQALQAAENAGIPIHSEAIRHGQEYLKLALGKYETAKAEQSRSRPADTAGALACNGPSPYSGKQNVLYEKWLKYCQTAIPVGRDIKVGRDELVHYYYAQAAYNFSVTWTSYRTATFDHLQTAQHKDGSWPAGDGIGVGQVYATAVWCTILQLDKGSHPSRTPEPIDITTRMLEARRELQFASKPVCKPRA